GAGAGRGDHGRRRVARDPGAARPRRAGGGARALLGGGARAPRRGLAERAGGGRPPRCPPPGHRPRPPRRGRGDGGMSTIAVAIHDVEPATFDRCALIRDSLADHGVDRVTLLVAPAPDLHPFFQRRPDLADWLL